MPLLRFVALVFAGLPKYPCFLVLRRGTTGFLLRKSASFPSFDMDRERTEIRNQADQILSKLVRGCKKLRVPRRGPHVFGQL